MANVKGRVKTPKTVSTKRGRAITKKSLTGPKGVVKATVSNAKECNSLKQPIIKLLPLDETVKNNTNGLTKNKLIIKPSKNSATHKKGNGSNEVGVQVKNGSRKKTSSHVTKSKRIKNKSKINLKLIDNILKSELMIENGKRRVRTYRQKQSCQVNNNNVVGISDQNKTLLSSDDHTSNNKNKSIEKTLNNISKSSRKTRNNSSSVSINKNNKKDSSKSSSTDESSSSDGRKCTSKTKRGRPKIAKNKVEDKKLAKTKQVTLSNGLVLTLSLFQCDYCNRTFATKSSIRRHIYKHLDLSPRPCPYCLKKFCHNLTMKTHIKRQHSKGNETKKMHYMCQICNKVFLLKENLSLHLASHVKNENSYKCIYCEKKFSYHLLLIQHEKQHMVTGRYQCNICSISYDCRHRLATHVKSHLKIKDYICQYCGREFLRLNSLRRHVQVSHGGHRIQCPICKKKLKGHLTEHMRTHEKRRPHECPECGQRFTQSTQLNVHRRAHTGARPYLCRICDRPFSHSNALMLHIRRHTGEKPFPCAMCPISFSQLPHMKAHMRRIHGKENPYKCSKCDQFFKLKAHLDNHFKTCKVGDRELSFEEKIQASVQFEEIEVESVMSLSRMRFLLALLLTMIATKERLKYLGFNKRLIDDLLVESLEAMDQTPCKDASLSPLKRLKANIQMLLASTVPKDELEKLEKENTSTEEILEILTDEKKSE